jgi:hypothetical protein
MRYEWPRMGHWHKRTINCLITAELHRQEIALFINKKGIDFFLKRLNPVDATNRGRGCLMGAGRQK